MEDAFAGKQSRFYYELKQFFPGFSILAVGPALRQTIEEAFAENPSVSAECLCDAIDYMRQTKYASDDVDPAFNLAWKTLTQNWDKQAAVKALEQLAEAEA